jgi:hypothetical protein
MKTKPAETAIKKYGKARCDWVTMPDIRLTNDNIAKAVMQEEPRLKQFKIARHGSGYFYIVTAIVDDNHSLTVESELTYSLAQRSFREWVQLWYGNVERAMRNDNLIK